MTTGSKTSISQELIKFPKSCNPSPGGVGLAEPVYGRWSYASSGRSIQKILPLVASVDRVFDGEMIRAA